MKKMKKTAVLILCIICFSCSETYSPAIETVLKLAGDNRPELEKVLKRYSKNPADSLKLRAAEFLIANMSDKYSVEYDVPFENLMSYCMRLEGIKNQQFANEAYGLTNPVEKEDVKYITGDYLISNIELAFKVWEEQPWGKDVPFNVFCEEILPYRIANEPLENWREKVLAGFAKLNSSFKTQPDITAIEACSQVNSQLPRFRLSYNVPDMNYSMIMSTTTGMCDEMVALTIFTMRALGIPVSKDYTLKWTNGQAGHSWNSVYAGVDKRLSFMGTESHRYHVQKDVYHHMSKSKVYRQTFVKQKNINADNNDIPPELHDQCMKDVTHEYFTSLTDTLLCNKGDCQVKIPIKYQPSKNTGYAYLAAKGINAWNIVGWGETNAKIINFGTIGRNILYLPLYYANGLRTLANYPFVINDDYNVRFFDPDSASRQELKITEMSPGSYDFMQRMHNGVFEGANRSDFSDAETLHTIGTLDGTYLYSVKLRRAKAYRYVRYVSPVEGHGNVAEIVFYNDRGEKLGGNPVGSSVPPNSPDLSHDKAFDGDLSTFYDTAPPDGAWTGLDFGEPQTVSELSYFPRHEGNFIYAGHTYDLFYWNDEWKVYERQTATSHILNFRIPSDGLYYLKSVTTGKTTNWFILNGNVPQFFEGSTRYEVE
jgi:hypothetical protein